MRKLSILLLIVFGCSSSQENKKSTATIDIDTSDYEESVMLSDVFKSLDVIPLNYVTAAQLGFIKSIKGSDDLIFVHEGSKERIVVFDKTGNFKGEINRQGPGPEEYGKINFFDINEARRTVEIYDIRKGELTAYNFDGEFKDKIDIRIISRDFAITKNGNYLFYVPDEMTEIDDQLLQPGVIVVNRKGSLLHYQKLGDSGYHPIISGNAIVNYKSKSYLFSNYTEQIYEIDDNGIRPYLEIKYSDKIDDNAYFNPNYNFENETAPFLKTNIFKSEDYLGYSFIQRNQGKNLLVDTRSNTYSISKVYKNDIKEDVFFFFNGGPIGDDLYASIIDYDMINSFKGYLKNEEVNNAFNRNLVNSIDEIMRDNNYSPILIVGSFRTD
ncbi:6-bladed beta-propeller [Roseivirga sp.]|uniref:6-bladed beta-propeller n=1 Tax=Roseivirga sp. TaxID=1964215 RepID=UPI003B8BDB46